jgi:hypothetical protein
LPSHTAIFREEEENVKTVTEKSSSASVNAFTLVIALMFFTAVKWKRQRK